MAGPNGTREKAFARFWEVALATFKQRAESTPPPTVRSGRRHEASSTRAGVQAKHGGCRMSMLLIDDRVTDVVGWRRASTGTPWDARRTE
jgi:hypothetical protein